MKDKAVVFKRRKNFFVSGKIGSGIESLSHEQIELLKNITIERVGEEGANWWLGNGED